MYSELKTLKFILDSGMLNKGTIEKANDEMIVEEKLNTHYYSWWKAKDGRYKTYVDTIESTSELVITRLTVRKHRLEIR